MLSELPECKQQLGNHIPNKLNNGRFAFHLETDCDSAGRSTPQLLVQMHLLAVLALMAVWPLTSGNTDDAQSDGARWSATGGHALPSYAGPIAQLSRPQPVDNRGSSTTRAAAANFVFSAAAPLDSRVFTCERPLDIVFCIDGSGSVSADRWPSVLGFVRDVVAFFDVGAGVNQMQVGVVVFSAAAQVVIPMYQFRNTTDLQAAIMGLAYPGGGTQTDAGIDQSQSDVVAYGRPPTVGGAHLILVITDGQSNNKNLTIAAADRARAGGSTVAVVTIGDSSKWTPGEVRVMVASAASVSLLRAGLWPYSPNRSTRPGSPPITNDSRARLLVCLAGGRHRSGRQSVDIPDRILARGI